VYRHFATLYFCILSDRSESELAMLDLIQVFVETLAGISGTRPTSHLLLLQVVLNKHSTTLSLLLLLLLRASVWAFTLKVVML
jgi:hypothetical protein